MLNLFILFIVIVVINFIGVCLVFYAAIKLNLLPGVTFSLIQPKPKHISYIDNAKHISPAQASANFIENAIILSSMEHRSFNKAESSYSVFLNLSPITNREEPHLEKLIIFGNSLMTKLHNKPKTFTASSNGSSTKYFNELMVA